MNTHQQRVRECFMGAEGRDGFCLPVVYVQVYGCVHRYVCGPVDAVWRGHMWAWLVYCCGLYLLKQGLFLNLELGCVVWKLQDPSISVSLWCWGHRPAYLLWDGDHMWYNCWLWGFKLRCVWRHFTNHLLSPKQDLFIYFLTRKSWSECLARPLTGLSSLRLSLG